MMNPITIPNSVESERELLGIMMFHTVDYNLVLDGSGKRASITYLGSQNEKASPYTVVDLLSFA